MSETFTFEMGEFDASFPTDYLYAKNHMWAVPSDAPEKGKRLRFGLTGYAVRLLQDVYFLDWIVDAPCDLKQRGSIGSIESKKAESDLFSPVTGTLVAINSEVLDDPSLINSDPYGEGWMLEIQCESSQLEILLNADEYAKHLEEAWDVAQRTIKGQANS